MEAHNHNSGQFITVDEAINSLLSREKDIAGVNKLHYKELSKDVFNLMNLSAIKQTKRILYTIDPVLHTITFPEEYWAFSTISAINHHHKIEPLVVNTDLTDDIVDLGLDKNCESDCGCTDALCNYSKHFETITEEVTAIMQDNTIGNFTKIIRKFINKDGSTYMEVTEPVAVYDNGTHTATTLQTTKTFLCKLQTKATCGCVIDNEFNRDTWAKMGSSLAVHGREDIMTEFGKPSCDYFPQTNTYNITEDGRRIVFPPDFPHKKVLVRMYVTNKTKDILIPYVAKESFLSGIKKISTEFDTKAPLNLKEFWKNKHVANMNLLRLILNRLMLTEYYAYIFGLNTTPELYYDTNNTYNADYHYPY